MVQSAKNGAVKYEEKKHGGFVTNGWKTQNSSKNTPED